MRLRAITRSSLLVTGVEFVDMLMAPPLGLCWNRGTERVRTAGQEVLFPLPIGEAGTPGQPQTACPSRVFQLARNVLSPYRSMAHSLARWPTAVARSRSAIYDCRADTKSSTLVDTTPARAGTARGASVVPSATTGIPRCIASMRERPNDVDRVVCT